MPAKTPASLEALALPLHVRWTQEDDTGAKSLNRSANASAQPSVSTAVIRSPNNLSGVVILCRGEQQQTWSLRLTDKPLNEL
jgi:hypothetical protein